MHDVEDGQERAEEIVGQGLGAEDEVLPEELRQPERNGEQNGERERHQAAPRELGQRMARQAKRRHQLAHQALRQHDRMAAGLQEDQAGQGRGAVASDDAHDHPGNERIDPELGEGRTRAPQHVDVVGEQEEGRDQPFGILRPALEPAALALRQDQRLQAERQTEMQCQRRELESDGRRDAHQIEQSRRQVGQHAVEDENRQHLPGGRVGQQHAEFAVPELLGQRHDAVGVGIGIVAPREDDVQQHDAGREPEDQLPLLPPQATQDQQAEHDQRHEIQRAHDRMVGRKLEHAAEHQRQLSLDHTPHGKDLPRNPRG